MERLTMASKPERLANIPERQHNVISSIPDDILSLILVRLPARSVIVVRLVCKSWYSLTKSPHFILSHARRARTSIVFNCQEKSILYHVSLNESAKGTARRIVVERETLDLPSELMEYFGGNFKLMLSASCDGLLCFDFEIQHNRNRNWGNRWWYWDSLGQRWWYWDSLGQRWWYWDSVGQRNSRRIGYVVVNPVTKDWLNIPRRSLGNGGNDLFINNFFIIAFYFHSSTGEYRLLGQYFERNRYEMFDIRNIGYEVFSIRGSNRGAWRPINASPGISSSWLLKSRTISVHGSIHFLYHNYQCIVAFDTNTEKFRKISISGVYRQDYLHDKGPNMIEIVMGGSLGLCQIYSNDQMDIWCLKDYTKEEWVKQYTVSAEDISNSIYKDFKQYTVSAEDISNTIYKDFKSCNVLAIWEDGKELLLQFGRFGHGYFVLYNLESKTCTKKEINKLRPYPKICMPHMESLVSCNYSLSSFVTG